MTADERDRIADAFNRAGDAMHHLAILFTSLGGGERVAGGGLKKAPPCPTLPHPSPAAHHPPPIDDEPPNVQAEPPAAMTGPEFYQELKKDASRRRLAQSLGKSLRGLGWNIERWAPADVAEVRRALDAKMPGGIGRKAVR